MEPLLESGEAEPEAAELLTWARQSGGPSESQLRELSARVAPAVGLPLAALDGASQAVGTAPSGTQPSGVEGGSLSPAAPSAGLGGESVVTKLSGGLIGKAGLAGLVGLGALVYVASRSSAPPETGAARTGAPEMAERTGAPEMEPAPAAEAPLEERVTPVLQAPAEVEAAPQPRVAEPASTRRPVRAARRAPAQVRPSELSLLQAAQDARGRPAQMLRALNRHARLYPQGMLGQERDVLRIEALVKLGRHDEAVRCAAELQRRHPGSAHLARVRELLDGSGGTP